MKAEDAQVSNALSQAQESALPPSDEILVTRSFLDEKQSDLVDFEPFAYSWATCRERAF